MSIPVIAGHELTNQDDFLEALTSRHPVSEEFVDAVRPTINAIFMNVPDDLRARMIHLAEDSFRRQSEVEAILRRAEAGLGRLRRCSGTRCNLLAVMLPLLIDMSPIHSLPRSRPAALSTIGSSVPSSVHSRGCSMRRSPEQLHSATS